MRAGVRAFQLGANSISQRLQGIFNGPVPIHLLMSCSTCCDLQLSVPIEDGKTVVHSPADSKLLLWGIRPSNLGVAPHSQKTQQVMFKSLYEQLTKSVNVELSEAYLSLNLVCKCYLYFVNMSFVNFAPSLSRQRA